MRQTILFLLALHLFPFHLLSQEKPAEKADSLRFQRLAEADFNRGMISSPLELLLGRLPGVELFQVYEPGAGPELRIRLGSPLSFFNQSLIVVDGLPMANDEFSGTRDPLAFLNPDDIASFTILKDAEATAIYGYRANNGVILIQTKSAEAGEKLQLNYHAGLGLSTATRLTPVLAADDFRELIRERYGDNHPAVQLLGDANTDWQDEILRHGSWNNHHLSFSGGVKNLPYRIAIGYTHENGLLKTDLFRRATTDMKLTPTFFRESLKLEFGFRTSFENNRFADQRALRSALVFNPSMPVYDPGNDFGGYTTHLQPNGNPNPLAPSNPLALLEQRENNANAQRLFSFASLEYAPRFIPNLKFHTRSIYDEFQSDRKDVISPLAASYSFDPGFVGAYYQRKYNVLLESWLAYERAGENFSLNLIGGVSYQRLYQSFSKGESNSSGTIMFGFSENWQVFGSYWGRATLNWRDHLTLNLSYRREAFFYTTLWPGGLPAASLAWKLFERDTGKLNFLKIRVGQNMTTYRAEGITPFRDVLPERHNVKNIGADFAFFQYRLQASATFFHRNINDLINKILVPTGVNSFGLIFANIGSMQQSGLELKLDAIAIQKKESSLTFGLNLFFTQNRIVNLYSGPITTDRVIYTGGITGAVGNTVQIHAEGHATNSFYLYEQVYDAEGIPVEGLYVDQNGDGQITPGDRYVKDKKGPDTRIGLNGSFFHKNISLSFVSSLRPWNLMYNQELSQTSNNLYFSTNYLINTHAEHASLDFNIPQYISDHFLQNASFFRLDNLRLAYQFPDGVGKNRPLSLAFISQNLFTLTNYEGRNPDLPWGLDNSPYPVARSWVLEIKMNL